VPPGGEITLTSYPASNKTSVSRKPCNRALHGPGSPRAPASRAGPCHSFWLNITTLVRKAHVGLMVLASGIPRSFKFGLTYKHHELSQDWYLRSPDTSTDQALLFILISFSIILISSMPICTLFDLCLWKNSHLFVPLFRHYKTPQFHTVIRILNWLFYLARSSVCQLPARPVSVRSVPLDRQ